jgi:hypothetical protein
MWLRKALFIGAILCLQFNSYGQSVLWASKVVAFSSEYTDQLLGKEFRAIHALGRPSKYPKFGQSPSAWQSLTPDSPNDEYLIVSFDSLKQVKQIAIFENFGAGSITRIEAFDENNKLYLIRELPINYAAMSGQITRVKLNSLTPFKVKSIKILMNSQRVKGFSQIDAIAISDDDKPIESSIALEKDPAAYLVKENLGLAINSKFNEICPVVSPDGKSLYFTRWKHPDNLGASKNQDIWVSQLGAYFEPAGEYKGLYFVLPEGEVKYFDIEIATLGSESSGAYLTFQSGNETWLIRGLNEEDGLWISKYKIELPASVLTQLIVGRSKPAMSKFLNVNLPDSSIEFESLVAYFDEASPTLVALNYLSSAGSFSRLNYQWDATDISADFYDDLATIEIKPENALKLVNEFDELDGIYPVKELLKNEAGK